MELDLSLPCYLSLWNTPCAVRYEPRKFIGNKSVRTVFPFVGRFFCPTEASMLYWWWDNAGSRLCFCPVNAVVYWNMTFRERERDSFWQTPLFQNRLLYTLLLRGGGTLANCPPCYSYPCASFDCYSATKMNQTIIICMSPCDRILSPSTSHIGENLQENCLRQSCLWN